MVLTKKFSEFADGGDLKNDNTTVGLESGVNTRFNNPWTFLPEGTTGDRPAPSPEMYFRLRFNTTLQSYEYYSSVIADWVQLEDSLDIQDFPFIIYTAEPLLPNSFDLGTLSTGILKQDVSLGVATPAIAINGTDYYGPGFAGYFIAPQGIADINSNPILNTTSSGISSVNYVRISNSVTGNGPTISAQGSDTDIDLNIVSAGTGNISLVTQNLTEPVVIYSGTTSQHITRFDMSDTAADRTATWQDSDGTVAWLSDVLGTVTSAEGTADQVFVNGTFGTQETGDIILTLPQDIAISSSPDFAGVTAGNIEITSNTISSVDMNGNIDLIPNGTGNILAFTSTPFNTIYPISFQCTTPIARARYNTGTGMNTGSFMGFGSRATGPGSFVALQNGDPICRTVAYGDDGTAFEEGGLVEWLVQGTVSTGVMPCQYRLYTTNLLGVRTLAFIMSSSQVLTLTNPLPVGSGGTGLATLTAYTLLAGGTTPTGNLQQVTAGTAGQLLQSNGASVLPSWTTATFPSGSGTLNHMLRSDGMNWVQTTTTTLDSSDNLAGLRTVTIGSSAGGTAGNLILYSPTAAKGDLQLLCADSVNAYDGILTNTSLNASRTWTLPDASGTIALVSGSGAFVYNSVSGTTQALLGGNAYIFNNAAATTGTLPTSGSSTIGDTIKIKGRSSASWIIQANTGQIITYGATSSSVAGTATSALGTDSLQLVYVASNEWSIDWALSSLITLA